MKNIVVFKIFEYRKKVFHRLLPYDRFILGEIMLININIKASGKFHFLTLDLIFTKIFL